VIAVLWFLTTGKNEHTPREYVDKPTVDACEPNLLLENDKPLVDNAPNPSQREQSELADMITDEIAKEADNILPAKIRKHRAELLETLSEETTLESIENLPNFDDTRVKQTISDLLPYDSYMFLLQFIPKLTRVRKILEETTSNPNQDEIIVVLMQKLENSIKDYREVLVEYDKAMLKGGGSITHFKPVEYQRRQSYAGATIYLLSELGAYKAMPLLSKVYFHESKVPVSRLFVFYSMHLLAIDHPRTGLSPESKTALDAYLEAAADLPKPLNFQAPTWKAAYHEADFRITIMMQDILKNQPKRQLRIYPPSLREFEKESWGTPTIDPHWLAVDAKIDELAKKLKVFIDAAYPDD